MKWRVFLDFEGQPEAVELGVDDFPRIPKNGEILCWNKEKYFVTYTEWVFENSWIIIYTEKLTKWNVSSDYTYRSRIKYKK